MTRDRLTIAALSLALIGLWCAFGAVAYSEAHVQAQTLIWPMPTQSPDPIDGDYNSVSLRCYCDHVTLTHDYEHGVWRLTREP